MKRQSLFLFGGLLLAIPAAVQAQFSYTVTNQTVTITGYTGTNDVVAIPSAINGLAVIGIGSEAFANGSITSVTIPNSVVNIGGSAFSYCSSLTSVTIPNSVISIGNSAFSGCMSLTNFTVPDSVTIVGDFAFFNCFSLTNITFGSGVTSIGASAFSGISKTGYYGCHLVNVTIPNSVTNIGSDAFFRCPSLINVTIPNSVTTIGSGAFSDCDSLTNIIVDPLNPAYSSVDGVLFNHDRTTLVQYPGGKVGNYTIPNSVASIGDGAFAFCFSLFNFTIPNSVTTIGSGAFFGFYSLTNIMVDPLNPAFSSVDGVLFNHDRTTLVQYPGSKVGYYTIPNSVTSIGDGAFAFCFSLWRLYFPGNAPGIGGTNVFYGTEATAYYLPGATGWGPTFGGIPTALWTLPYPLILNGSVAVRTNQFGFTVSWATNLNVVVETATDLANPSWSPVQTNTLTSGSFYFSDPQWKNYPARFYRIRSQ